MDYKYIRSADNSAGNSADNRLSISIAHLVNEFCRQTRHQPRELHRHLLKDGMIISKDVERGPIKEARTIKKRHKLYIYVFAVFAVAAVIAVSLVLTKQFDGDTCTESNSTQVFTPPERPLLLFTGDSLTEQGIDPANYGWVTLLQNQYSRSADIIPRGLSGYNTRWFLKYAMPIIKYEIQSRLYTPAVVTVWLGANDHALANGSNAARHVPLDQYTANLVQIVQNFQGLVPAAHILLVTPPHIDDAVREKYAAERSDDMQGVVDRSNAMAGVYAQACVETGSKLGVPVLDLYTYFNGMPMPTRNALLADGLHFNTKGNKLASEQLRKKVEAEFPDVADALKSWEIPPSSKWVKEDPWIPGDSTE